MSLLLDTHVPGSELADLLRVVRRAGYRCRTA